MSTLINNTTYYHIHQPTCATTHVPSRHQHNPLCIHHLLHNLIVQILTLLAEQLIDMREREDTIQRALGCNHIIWQMDPNIIHSPIHPYTVTQADLSAKHIVPQRNHMK